MSKRMAIVLAAGKGTRMKSDLYKVLHPINGITMVEHVIRAVQGSGVEQIVTIVGQGSDQVQETIGQVSDFAFQAEQLGTAHAVQQAESFLTGQDGHTLVICGDAPLLTSATLNQLFNYHESNQADATILTAITENPSDYGRIARDSQGEVAYIVEKKDASPEELLIKEVNSGTFIFNNKLLFEALKEIDNNNSQGEYYLTDVIGILKNQGKVIAGYVIEDFDETIGINDRQRLADVTRIMSKRINQAHMNNGVTFMNPDHTHIDIDVVIGSDTTIEGGVTIQGKTTIGSHCYLGANTSILNSEIGSHTKVYQSFIEDSKVGQQCKVGPFARLRNQAQLMDHVSIGNFVEVKKSQIGCHSKAGHLAYIGDATIGEHVNVGCGTVFANYDGKRKNQSIVGDHSFIGSGSILVAPINLGDNTVIAAGSTLTEDLPSQSLGIARAKQVNKSNYWERFINK